MSFGILIISNDVWAYFVGRKFKGPKLAPKISPGKTWSGFIGSMILSTVTVYILIQYHIFPVNHAYSNIGLIAVILGLSLLSHSGDLLESWMKRRVHIKDTGRLFLGHGGFLDRFDSMIWVCFCLQIYSWMM